MTDNQSSESEKAPEERIDYYSSTSRKVKDFVLGFFLYGIPSTFILMGFKNPLTGIIIAGLIMIGSGPFLAGTRRFIVFGGLWFFLLPFFFALLFLGACFFSMSPPH